MASDQAIERVNFMNIGYAEIDGKPARLIPEGKLKPQISRKVIFTEPEAGHKHRVGTVQILDSTP